MLKASLLKNLLMTQNDIASHDDDDNGIIKKKVKKLEERIELAKMKIGALLDAKDNDIQELKHLVIQQKEVTK